MVQIRPGEWRISVSLGTDPLTGKRRRAVRTVHGSRKQAAEVRAELVATSSSKTPTARKTVGEAADHMLATAPLSDRTRDEYRIVRGTLLAKIEKGRLDLLTRGDVERWMLQIRDEVDKETGKRLRQVGRVHKAHQVLTKSLDAAVRAGWVGQNVSRGALRPALESKPNITPVSPDEANEILAALAEHPTGLAIQWLAETGARRGEACGLRWADVDGQRIVIRRAITEPKGGLVVKETKTGNERTVMISADLAAAMQQRKELQRLEALRTKQRARWQKGGYVFARSSDGLTPFRPSYLSHAWRRAMAEVGVDVHLHALRHAAGQELVERLGTALASKWLGHANEATTVAMYYRPSDAALAAGAEAMSDRYRKRKQA